MDVSGMNDRSQFGIGYQSGAQTTFMRVNSLSGVLKIAARDSSTFVQKSDKTWWAAGSNAWGLLGLTGHTQVFREIPEIRGAPHVYTNYSVTFAQMPDGVWLTSGSIFDTTVFRPMVY